MSRIRRIFRASVGATTVEYAVLVGLVIIAIITAIMVVGQRTATSYSTSAQSIESAAQSGS